MSTICPECRRVIAPGVPIHTATIPASFTLTGRNRAVTRTWHDACFASAQASADDYRAEVAAYHREVMLQLAAANEETS